VFPSASGSCLFDSDFDFDVDFESERDWSCLCASRRRRCKSRPSCPPLCIAHTSTALAWTLGARSRWWGWLGIGAIGIARAVQGLRQARTLLHSWDRESNPHLEPARGPVKWKFKVYGRLGRFFTVGNGNRNLIWKLLGVQSSGRLGFTGWRGILPSDKGFLGFGF
jgi:hypothetical protein